jgi:hypothetical protein
MYLYYSLKGRVTYTYSLDTSIPTKETKRRASAVHRNVITFLNTYIKVGEVVLWINERPNASFYAAYVLSPSRKRKTQRRRFKVPGCSAIGRTAITSKV